MKMVFLMNKESDSNEEGGGDFEEHSNTPDPAQPWCSKCAKHTEGREKILDFFVGISGRSSRSYGCNECGKTMWAPASCRSAGIAAIVCLWGGLAGMVATLFAVRTSLGTSTTVYMVAAEGMIVLYFYVCGRAKKRHLERFKRWSKRKGSVYGS